MDDETAFRHKISEWTKDFTYAYRIDMFNMLKKQPAHEQWPTIVACASEGVQERPESISAEIYGEIVAVNALLDFIGRLR